WTSRNFVCGTSWDFFDRLRPSHPDGRQPVKHPLARALRSVGMEPTDVAARLGVDPKTVQRWMGGRVPYPRHRDALVNLTGWMPRDLWPNVATSIEPVPADEVKI